MTYLSTIYTYFLMCAGLALHVYRAAADALFLAFASKRGAAKLGKENPIVHLRFTRIVESGGEAD